MKHETKYAKGSEGLIAYQVIGEGPRDLVYLTGGASHVDARWESPYSARFCERLASFSRVILFDRRGVGASDPVHLDALPTWEEWTDDLRVVMDAAGSERAAVFGVLDAGGTALLFAASHPDRTTALILGNATARWLAADDYSQGVDAQFAKQTMDFFEETWGTENGAALSLPSLAADAQERARMAKYMRASASPRMAAAQLRAIAETDLREALPLIRVPTMVFHRREFAVIPVEQGRYIAERIPDAKFVELGGIEGSLVYVDADFVLDQVEEFVTGARRQPDADRVLATVLITDLVESTRRLATFGDRTWRDLLNRHDELARSHIESHGGKLRELTGDGVLATFDAPGRAIRCALALGEALNGLGLPMRAGLHAGEVELRGDGIGGIAVHTTARVSALAGANEILVSRTVADLVAGSGITLVDRGVHELKGVPGEWQLFLVGE